MNPRRFWPLVMLLVFLAASRPVPAIAADARAPELLDLAQARAYMVEVINRDRAAKNLKPVKLDNFACAAAQWHAEEMASKRYMSHYNLAGKSPNQRYTEAGGTGYSRENVYLSATRYVGEPDDASQPYKLADSARFTRQEIEEIEASYFNEVPPHDGHRRNILAPEQTHVGVGLARGVGPSGRSLANAQEFVAQYAEMEPLTAATTAGKPVRVAGRIIESARFRSVSIGKAPLPRSLSREEAAAIRSYSVPKPDTTYWPAPFKSKRVVTVTDNGSFWVDIALSGPGLYYIGVWVEESGRDMLGSLRTIEVR